MNEYGQLILCNKHNFASKSIINPIILMRKLRLQPNLSDFKGCGLSVTTHTHTHTHTQTHTYLFMIPKHPVKIQLAHTLLAIKLN